MIVHDCKLARENRKEQSVVHDCKLARENRKNKALNLPYQQ